MEKPCHYRRCHICGAVSARHQDKVERCGACGKSLAPFYYFDDRITAIPSEGQMRPPLMKGEYPPIQGLTAYWESF